MGRGHRRAGAPRDRLAGHPHRRADRRPGRRRRLADRFRDACGLPLATYFSGPKIRWLLDAVPSLRARAEAGEVLFGTVDTWLIWKLTGRHVTDVTNASRTMLMNLSTLDWDDELLAAFGVPRAMLPEILPSSYVYGEAGGLLAGVPVAGALGDQQAALFGQTCFAAGEAKCTYGTGSFLLLNTGDAPGARARAGWSRRSATRSATPHRCTPWRARSRSPARWCSGCATTSGSSAPRPRSTTWPRRCRTTAGATSCRRSPACSPRTGAPTRAGVIAGLTGYVTKGHLARAALEATAWQVARGRRRDGRRLGRPVGGAEGRRRHDGAASC